jgi:hypothetical protein
MPPAMRYCALVAVTTDTLLGVATPVMVVLGGEPPDPPLPTVLPVAAEPAPPLHAANVNNAETIRVAAHGLSNRFICRNLDM